MSKVNSREYDNIDPGFLSGGASHASYELGGSSSAANSNNYGFTTLRPEDANNNNGYRGVDGDMFVSPGGNGNFGSTGKGENRTGGLYSGRESLLCGDRYRRKNLHR